MTAWSTDPDPGKLIVKKMHLIFGRFSYPSLWFLGWERTKSKTHLFLPQKNLWELKHWKNTRAETCHSEQNTQRKKKIPSMELGNNSSFHRGGGRTNCTNHLLCRQQYFSRLFALLWLVCNFFWSCAFDFRRLFFIACFCLWTCCAVLVWISVYMLWVASVCF